ncbi:AAA family ATPase [Brevibacterium yomogidense]|uniref:AAA family ATPase n=1 Tax=Brevibacterium yomogidense TaxID=946573 RepID=UPI0018DF1AA2
MRPHHLVIEGFGPFRDRQTIDFDSVSHDGIFLIAGPTGAGKTSILDALCFALFNTVPGPRGSASDLRSHLAAPTDPTRVELTFTASGRRFRIERTPQYLRPRKRGTGMTTQSHTVALAEWVDGEWAGISRTAQETQAFLDAIVGLNAAQFTKLVVLPQGDFAAFLHADPTEREGILEKLFATEHFRAVERVLGERATRARRLTEKGDHERRFALESAAHSSWETAPLPTATPTVVETLAFLRVIAVSARERAEVADFTSRLAERCAKTSEEAARGWQQRIEDRTALAALREDEATWAAALHEREALRLKADRARAAHSLSPQLKALQRAQAEAARLDDASRRARDEALKAMPAEARVPLDELTDKDIAAAAAHLDRAEDGLARRAILEKLVADTEAEAAAAAEEAERARSILTGHEARAEELRAESERLRTTFDGLEDIASARDQLREHQRAIAAVQTAIAQRDSAHARLINASHAAEASARALEATRRAMREDSAGSLAATLVAGQPCPVCGACEHPDPARPTGEGPSPDDEADDEAADTAARSALAAAEASYEGADQSLTTARAAAAGIEADRLEERLAEAESAVTKRVELRAAMASTGAALRDVGPRLEAARAAVATADAAYARTSTAYAQARSRFDESSESSVAEAPSSWTKLGVVEPSNSVAARCARAGLDRLTTARTTWLQARGEAERGRRDMRTRTNDLTAALADSPFADVASLEAAAALPLEDLEKQLDAHREHATRLALRRESPPIIRARDDTCTDDALTDASEQAEADAERDRARADVASEHGAVAQAAATAAHAAFRRTLADRTEDEDRITELQRDIDLAELVLGTSTDAASRMSLSSYALAALFAEVAVHASDRLVDMTAGRYRLEHDLERRRGDRRTGLGLKIVDTFTDESRDPRTLSGGEGFMASLALALGMADTVRAETGGIDLDALFLDEGFGTLDPDTLSDVLAVLDRLRTGGRTIGIISHVAELQQAITTRVMVAPGPSGASIRVEAPQVQVEE